MSESPLPTPFSLSPEELSSSGVAKLLLQDKEELKKEVKALKKSLKATQDELEAEKVSSSSLDRDNAVLSYRLRSSFFSELMKFLASAILAGLGITAISTNQVALGLVLILSGIALYIIILWIYRNE